MREIAELVAGYRAFYRDDYPRQAALYHSLAEFGQTPRTMIIGCCDSRVDPSRIFSARPGELFIVRNVANLVPPCEPRASHHGTSAALEFAVTILHVENIVILGHARCGGIQAFLDTFMTQSGRDTFISKWMSLLRPACSEVLEAERWSNPAELRQALEQVSIRHSLENLKTFPFIRERLDAGELRLHGGYFDIASGRLQALDAATATFEVVE